MELCPKCMEFAETIETLTESTEYQPKHINCKCGYCGVPADVKKVIPRKL